MELNVVENKARLLENAILDFVNPQIAEALSRYRWKKQEEETLLATDQRYQELHEALKQRVTEIREEVEAMETVFDAKWSSPINAESVREMTHKK